VLSLPILDETRCTHCGDCVRICPPRCLEQGSAGPWLPRPLDCVACGLCVKVCTADALRLQPLPPIE
jgi:NAD-dependent dihydropyrimidine dehydrogenase PreA subunit